MIKTASDLLQKIADDLIWRKRELTELLYLIKQNNSTPVRDALLVRAATTMLYAHWEGFVKKSGTYYLEFVSDQRHKNNELRSNFISLTLKSKLNQIQSSKKISSTNDVVDFFCTKLSNRANFSTKNAVNTNSNLSSKTLEEILWTLGLDSAPYKTKFSYIDTKLVDRRNHIAHGEALDLNRTEYLELHQSILDLMEIFRNQVENASVMKSYLRIS